MNIANDRVREYTAHSLALERLKTGAIVRVRALANELGVSDRTLSTVLIDLEKKGVIKRVAQSHRSGYVAVDPSSINVVMRRANQRGSVPKPLPAPTPVADKPLHPLYAVFGIRKVEIELLNSWGRSRVLEDAA